MALRKVFFKLEPDEDGYPPVGVESVWAEENEDGTCVLIGRQAEERLSR
jgi:hypothetical protein